MNMLTSDGIYDERVISFSCDFKLQGKARARGGKFGHYTPAKTVAYEKAIGFCARSAMSGQLLEGACSMEIRAGIAMPKSWSKKKRALLSGRAHTSKPDADNAIKSICDALNGIIYRDDAQVAQVTLTKRWAEADRFSVTVRGFA